MKCSNKKNGVQSRTPFFIFSHLYLLCHQVFMLSYYLFLNCRRSSGIFAEYGIKRGLTLSNRSQCTRYFVQGRLRNFCWNFGVISDTIHTPIIALLPWRSFITSPVTSVGAITSRLWFSELWLSIVKSFLKCHGRCNLKRDIVAIHIVHFAII